ncbi:hypothetical protein H310_00987 [Aphanomyces invadans]|uniref:Uncharacterized protein n=1 Tax=Aphanomyces invadans TaxID=157072 RepID=A0A024URE2_9STRA|nr:hypothetical protein H310_00987 [Aphanomyces invadans]ETW08397.1 hypothetical protein H310_00987 [Aphanomyces invadans]|eukprot:XP_008862202.1 hypothetical protein H310_00987 [Aphanomyces invadans]
MSWANVDPNETDSCSFFGRTKFSSMPLGSTIASTSSSDMESSSAISKRFTGGGDMLGLGGIIAPLSRQSLIAQCKLSVPVDIKSLTVLQVLSSLLADSTTTFLCPSTAWTSFLFYPKDQLVVGCMVQSIVGGLSTPPPAIPLSFSSRAALSS